MLDVSFLQTEAAERPDFLLGWLLTPFSPRGDGCPEPSSAALAQFTPRTMEPGPAAGKPGAAFGLTRGPRRLPVADPGARHARGLGGFLRPPLGTVTRGCDPHASPIELSGVCKPKRDLKLAMPDAGLLRALPESPFSPPTVELNETSVYCCVTLSPLISLAGFRRRRVLNRGSLSLCK